MIDNQYKYITMATLYNKTALKKIKKDELIKLFLDQQAEMNDMELTMEKDKYDGRWPEDVQAINVKDNLIDKLQDENTKMKTHLIKYEQLMNKLHTQIKKWENPPDC
jgi:hypothetical protein